LDAVRKCGLKTLRAKNKIMKLLRSIIAAITIPAMTAHVMLALNAYVTAEEPISRLPPIEAGYTEAGYAEAGYTEAGSATRAAFQTVTQLQNFPLTASPDNNYGLGDPGPILVPGADASGPMFSSQMVQPEFAPPGSFPVYEEFPEFDPSMPPAPLDRLPEFKAGSFFQKAQFAATVLPGARSATDMRITELELALTFAAPLPTENHPLLITPSFETRFLEGPLGVDTPGQLHSAFVQFIWVPQITTNWSLILGIEPGVYGDFENSDDDAFRLLGRGLVRYQPYPGRLEFVAGLLYLDRDDVNILPAGGVLWSPTDNLKLDIIFPAPKLAYRYFYDGRKSRWIYLAGEFGGDTWAVRRENGAADRLTLSDLRASVGLETMFGGGTGWRLEVGYVFSRNLEYTDGTDVTLDDAIMLRAVVSY